MTPMARRGTGVACAVAAVLWALIGRVDAADLAEIRAKGTLRVLAAADEDPAWFSLRSSPSPGFEREVLEGFVRVAKLRFEVVPVARWEEAIPMLLRQDGDVVAGMSATPERQKRVDFSAELLPVQVVVVTRRPAAPVRSLAELAKSRLAVVPNTSWSEAVERAGLPATRVTRVPDIAGAIELIRVGHADATVTGVVDFLLQRRRHPDLEAGLALGQAMSSAWAVRKDNPALRAALDGYLAELRRGPNWSRLLVKYFGDDAPAILGRQPRP